VRAGYPPAGRTIGNNIRLAGDATLGANPDTTHFWGSIDLGGEARTVSIPSAGTHVSGSITNGGLTKTGNGTLVLTGNNTYAGDTVVAAGTLALGSAGAIGTAGTISFTGGALRFSAANTTDYSPRFSTAAGQAYALDTNGQNIELATALTSVGGTLTLSGANTYSGDTTIAAGTLEVTGVLGGGTHAGAIANAGSLLFNSASNQTLSGVISASGGLVKSAAGNFVLSGSDNYTGPTSITAGRLSVKGSLAGSAVTV